MSWDSCHHSATVIICAEESESGKRRMKRLSVKNAKKKLLSETWLTMCSSLKTFFLLQEWQWMARGNHFSGSKMFHANLFLTYCNAAEREGASLLWWCIAKTYQSRACFSLCWIKKEEGKKKTWARWYERFLALMLVWKIKDHVNAHQHGVTGI